MPTPLEHTLQHAGYALLNDRAMLRITGSDATRWLNGMVTNSAQALAPGEGNYNFLLNAQGRIQADCLIFRTQAEGEPSYVLSTDTSQMETIQAHLDRFIIMDDVELTPAHPGASSLLLLGPEAPGILESFDLAVPETLHLTQTETPDGAALLFSLPPSVVPGLELRAEPSVLETWIRTLRDQGVPELTQGDLEQLRVLAGTPKMGTDIRDRELPQETNQMQALHFAKGCYLGQEIVERIRSRGQVHRAFGPFLLHGAAPGTLPAPLEANGKPAGELTSVAAVGLNGRTQLLALGYARREFLDTHAPLTYAGGMAVPRAPGLPS